MTNVSYAVYRSALAKLTKQKPTLEVVPPSGDSEDQEAAELAEALLTYLWRLLKKPSKLPIALGWLLVTGQAWLRVGYDPQAGQTKPRTVPVPRAKVPLGAPEGAQPVPSAGGDGSQLVDEEDVDVACDEDGEPYRTPDGAIDFEREPDLEPMGEITFDTVSPLCVRLNPEATSIDDADEMFVATLWPKEKCADHFGVDAADLGGGDESAEIRALYEDLMSASAAGFPRSWADRTSVYGVSQQDAIGDRILVIEYYAKQGDDYPEGRHWITAGVKKVWPPADAEQAKAAQKKVVTAGEDGDADTEEDSPVFEHGEAPLPFGFWPPLVPIMDTPIPGQPSAIGVITQVVPINEALNILDGKIAEKHVMDSMGGIWFASPEDKGLEITSEPAQIVYSKAMGRRGQGFAPFQARMEALPEAVYREREVLMSKVQVVAGISSLDLRQAPEGTPSGRALLVSQETSDGVLMPTLVAVEAALEECGRRELVIASEKYREERMIAVKGNDGRWIYRSFKNADLRNGHDVRVQVGSSFPWSKSAQWDTRVSFLQAVPALFTDPQTGKVDDAKLAKFLDSGTPGLGAFESDENPDLLEIQREHSMFEVFDPSTPDGSHQLPQIAFWQTHPVHLKEHFDFMKRDWARYQRWHPAAQEAFKQHMQLTMLAIEKAAEQMMGPQQPAAGAGDPAAAGDAAAQGGAAGAPPVGAAPGAPGAGQGPQLVRPESTTPGPGTTRLTRGDFAAARTG